MKGFTDQGKRAQEFLELFLVGKELTTDGKVDYSTTTDARNRINIITIEMTRTDIYKLEIYMKENSKEINSGVVTIHFNLDDYERIVNPLKASNLGVVNEDWYNGLKVAFNKSKDFKKILNILKKFL